MFEYTGVDGIMIGRGAIGNPWIFKTISEQTLKEATLEERLQVIIEHLNSIIEDKGEYVGIREFRKHICWYLKKLKDSSKIRERANQIESRTELIECVTEYFKTI